MVDQLLLFPHIEVCLCYITAFVEGPLSSSDTKRNRQMNKHLWGVELRYSYVDEKLVQYCLYPDAIITPLSLKPYMNL